MGREGANVAQGLAILQGSLKKRDKWLRQFLVSSVQSYLCNRYLAERVGMGAFDRLLAGMSPRNTPPAACSTSSISTRSSALPGSGDKLLAPLFGPAMWAAQSGKRNAGG